MCRQDRPARPVASYLHGDSPQAAGQADRGAGRGRGWLSRSRACAYGRGGRDRLRAEGRQALIAGCAFTDRVIATLVILRFQLPHAALALFYEVDRSTITRAVGEIRPLLAARGFAVPGKPGLRLRTLADVFAYAAAEGVELRIDGTEVQVRRPPANRPGRRAFVSGKEAAEHQEGRCREPIRPAAPCGPAPSGQAACTTRPP